MITADGSSTVFPITEAVAEEFQKANAGTRVTVGSSGTGGGFQKFCRNETDLSNASRPIKSAEARGVRKAGIEFIELPIAYDGLAIVVNPKNTWVTSMTVADLKKLWEPAAQGKVKRWNQIRPEWPDQEIHLFGAGVDSGTFDYFTEAIVGKEGQSRGDYTSSEDDNVIVQGVSGDANALGYFGYAYYEQNKDKLKVVPIDDGDAANGAGPDRAVTGNGGGTAPIGRCRAPVFIYPKVKALDRPEVKAFVEFYLDKGAGAGARSRLHSAARQGTGAGADAVRGAQDRHDVHRHGQPQPGDPGTASHPIDHGADVATRDGGPPSSSSSGRCFCAPRGRS